FATTSRTSPSTREMAVAKEKIAVETASRLGGLLSSRVAAGSAASRGPGVVASSATSSNVTRAGGGTGALLPFRRPLVRAFCRHAAHQAAEEARADRRGGAPREPPLPLDDQDSREAPRGDRRVGRCRGDGCGASRPREADRPGCRTRRAPPERRRAEEVAGRAGRLGRR